MKYILIIALLIPITGLTGTLEYSEKYMAAEKLYKDWKKDEAKILYLEAAKAGDANAHYAIGAKYALDEKFQLTHLQAAAESGHKKALKLFIDKVFFRSDSFEYSNPSLAIEVYKKSKSANPSIKLYKEQETLKVISQCLETKSLDVDQFLSKYSADKSESPWRWARKVSNNENNPELVLSLICLGGHVPNEKMAAIKSYHKSWKEKKVVKFNGCHYAASNYTMAICSRNERY